MQVGSVPCLEETQERPPVAVRPRECRFQSPPGQGSAGPTPPLRLHGPSQGVIADAAEGLRGKPRSTPPELASLM